MEPTILKELGRNIPAVAEKAAQLRSAMPDLWLTALIKQVPEVLTLVRLEATIIESRAHLVQQDIWKQSRREFDLWIGFPALSMIPELRLST